MTVQTLRDASGQCCELHQHGAATLGWVDTERGRKLLWRSPCCDPDDCSPWCLDAEDVVETIRRSQSG